MIVPDIKDLLKHQAVVKEIKHLRYKIDQNSLSGNLNSKFKGDGLDFMQTRKYYIGDDVRNFDWKVTARTGAPHIKEFKLEKENDIAIIANLGAEMQFATFGKFKYLIACDIIALLCFAANNNHENITAYFFGNNISNLKIFRQRKQQDITLEILDFLTQKKSLVSAQGHYNLTQTLKEFNQLDKQKGIVFILCDFHNINDEIIAQIRQIKRKKNIYICHIYDLAEKQLKSLGNLSFSDYEKNKYNINSNDKIAAKQYYDNFMNNYQKLKILEQESNIYLLDFATHLKPIEQLINL